MLTDADEIANEFNNYFVNIGRLLSEQITSPHTSKEYLGDRPNVSFKFSPVSEDRISNITNICCCCCLPQSVRLFSPGFLGLKSLTP